MAACVQTPTLTLFATVISTTVVTTVTAVVKTVQSTASTFIATSCLSIVAGACVSAIVDTRMAAIPGGLSTVTVPITITNSVVEVNPTTTLFAGCSSLSTTGTGSLGLSPSYSSSLPASTIISVTTTPSPAVVTQVLLTSYNGVASVVTVISTSTPSPSVVPVVTAAGPSHSPAPHSNDAAPIAGGVLGGFFFLVGVVTAVWYIMRKCRKPREHLEEEDLLFPFPVTRDPDRAHLLDLDLDHEPRPYVYGLVGSTTADIVTTRRNSISHPRTANDGRRDSTTVPLIGTPSPGLATPVASASTGNAAAARGAQVRNGEVERQTLQSSTSQLPPGARPPLLDPFRSSGGDNTTSPGPSWFPLQPLQPTISPAPIRSIPGAAPSTNYSKPLPTVPVLEIQPERPEETPTQDHPSSTFIHTNWGRQQAPDRSPRKQYLPRPRVSLEAPPAYVA